MPAADSKPTWLTSASSTVRPGPDRRATAMPMPPTPITARTSPDIGATSGSNSNGRELILAADRGPDPSRLATDEPPVVGIPDGLGPAACADLGEQVIDVALDRHLGDIELIGDLPVRPPGRDRPEHVGLPRGQVVGERRRLGRPGRRGG